MQAKKFNTLMSDAFAVPEKSVIVYTRLLKEAGLLTSGKGGRAAPHMTPLDAARVTIALLASDAPSQAVERVKRFGTIPYSPKFEKSWPWYENIGQEGFEAVFEGETLEEVLAFMFGRVGALGLERAAKWFNDNVFHLRINDFDVLAELVSWKTEDGKPVGEIVVPFCGDPLDDTAGSKIRGSIRTTRKVLGMKFLEIGLQLVNHAGEGGRYRGCDLNGYPLDPAHPWNVDLPPDERAKRRLEIEKHIAKLEAEGRGGR